MLFQPAKQRTIKLAVNNIPATGILPQIQFGDIASPAGRWHCKSSVADYVSTVQQMA